MRPTFKRLDVKDIGELERLVAENVEGIESGLKVIDSRLLLGQAAIDLVGLDAKGALVLIALDFTADEGLLLRVMDAYSWCLEYPDTMRRLYPMAQVSENRPPRILFIVERLTDSFVRRIKQLRFLEIDCLEFRHLEVNGASALYFDLVQQLRRVDTVGVPSPEHEPRLPRTPSAPEAPAMRQVPSASPASVEPAMPPLVPAVAPAPAVAEGTETPASEQVAPEPVAGPTRSFEALAAELLAQAEESLVEESRGGVVEPAAEPVPADMPPQPEIRIEAVEEKLPEVEVVRPLVNPADNPEWQALLSELGVETRQGSSAPIAEPEATTTTHEEAEAAMAAEAPEEPAEVPPAAVEPPPAPIEAPAPPQPPAWAKPADKPIAAPSGGRTYFFAQAVKGTAPADAPTAVAAGPGHEAAPVAAAAPAAPSAGAPRAVEGPAEAPSGFEALNFPKDGLSRQWLEFLNQLGATK